MSVLYQLGTSVREQHLLGPGERIAVACSGGQDSMGLLFALYQLHCQWEWELSAAHCNHLWSSDSTGSASRVAQVGLCLGTAVQIGIPGDYAPGEARARSWRWRCLTRMAMAHNHHRVCTGHTASDRAEALLGHLMRAGHHGLPWHRPGPVPAVRPALGITRAALGAYGRAWGLPLCTDPSNQDRRLRRNRIRHELLPYLREWWDSGTDAVLAESAQRWDEEERYLSLVVQQLCQAHEWIGRDAVRLPRDAVALAPRALRPRLVRCFASRAAALLVPGGAPVPNGWVCAEVGAQTEWLIVRKEYASSWIRTSDDKVRL